MSNDAEIRRLVGVAEESLVACEESIADAQVCMRAIIALTDEEIEPPPEPTGPVWLGRPVLVMPADALEVQLEEVPVEGTFVAWIRFDKRLPTGRPQGVVEIGDHHALWVDGGTLAWNPPWLTAPIQVSSGPDLEAVVVRVTRSTITIRYGELERVAGIEIAAARPVLYVGQVPVHKGVLTEMSGVIVNAAFWDRALDDDAIAAWLVQTIPDNIPPPPSGGLPVQWAPPAGLSVSDGLYDPAINPAVAPRKGNVIENMRFTQWIADDYWPRGGRAAVADSGPGRDPLMSWTMRRCHVMGGRNGEVIRAGSGLVTMSDLWVENVENLAIKLDEVTSGVIRDCYLRDVTTKDLQAPGQGGLIWHNSGGLKITGGDGATKGPRVFLDVDRFVVERAWHGVGIWSDWGPNIRRIHNTTLFGGFRWRALMLEMSAGETGGAAPHLLNVHIGHACQEPAIGQPWSNVFNGALLLMNTGGITGRGLVIVAMPTPSSCIAIQDDHLRDGGGHKTMPYLDRMTVAKDLDLEGLFVLRGSSSTLSRAYASQPGLDGALSGITIDGEVWVEADSQSAADARARTFGAGTLTVRAMTRVAIEDGLRDRGLGHLL